MDEPTKNNQLIDAVLSSCNKHTLFCIAANITGSNEMIRTMSIEKWKIAKPDLHKIPAVFLLGK